MSTPVLGAAGPTFQWTLGSRTGVTGGTFIAFLAHLEKQQTYMGNLRKHDHYFSFGSSVLKHLH